MPTQRIDLRPAIEPIVRELLRPLEEKIKELEDKIQEQKKEIEKLKPKK
jgi:hypothetical protein